MKRPKLLLVVALVMCLVSAVGAHLLQTNGGQVKVTQLTLPGSDGAQIEGVLFRPESASADNPMPLIVAGHGSFNNKEMQDSFALELSRRGFIVFTPDSYRHGNSSVHSAEMGEYTSMVDSVEALYGMNYVDQSKVAVMGHSMGADQANNTARHYIELAATGEGPNKIAAVLTVGADPAYASYDTEGLTAPTPIAVDYGVVQGRFDEWFFKQPDVGMNPARFLESANARAFIGQVGEQLTSSVENGKVYRGEIAGEPHMRVIYQNPEIHPWNHFSTASAASAVDFFYESLGTPSGFDRVDAGNQTWFAKELFNLLGLVGFFLFLLPFSSVLLRTRFFSDVVTAAPGAQAPRVATARDRAAFWGGWVLQAALPALLFLPVGFAWIGQETFVPAIFTDLFGQASTNELAGWSIVAAVVLLGVLVVVRAISAAPRVRLVEAWGISATPKSVAKALLLAVITVAAAFLLVFVLHYFFTTDFRFWVLAVKTFDPLKLGYALLYMPAFVLFYLVNSIGVNSIHPGVITKEWLRVLLSCVANVLGLVVLIVIQYSSVFAHGTEAFNAMRIVSLFPLVVLIPVATIISRHYFRRTGNVYTGSFVFGILYAIITTANTMFLGSLA